MNCRTVHNRPKKRVVEENEGERERERESMEAALVSSQTAETKVERRIGWILRNRLPEI